MYNDEGVNLGFCKRLHRHYFSLNLINKCVIKKRDHFIEFKLKLGQALKFVEAISRDAQLFTDVTHSASSVILSSKSILLPLRFLSKD